MNIAQAKCIPIDAYLEQQGLSPKQARQNGRELWYHSPIREDDANPSFKVDTIKNLWFDHGAATGGTIIDLVKEICACDIRDALQHLEKTKLYSPALAKPSMSKNTSRGVSRRDDPSSVKKSAAGEKEKTGPLELVSSQELKHPALLQYLTKRGIDHDIARRYLSEIVFEAPQSAGNYFSLGYPAGDGFEARNELFKGFVGTGKNVTFHDAPEAKLLQVFEGFFDFLAYLSAKRLNQPVGAVLVLNSTNLWRRALPYITDLRFDEIKLYLDNDDAGDAVTKSLLETDALAKIADMRSYYEGFEDLNAWHLGHRA